MILTMAENPSSKKLQVDRIQQLISKSVKHTNFNYRCVAGKFKADRWASRQDKVWRRCREDWSVEAFKEARQRYWKWNQFQQRQFIEQMEKAHERR
jgi:hypothetical protein